ncbi:MAG TPA: hypothetical protein VI818_07220, partial [Candidatus Thermoplasmatota archaeon]|nr:hypothetical protein [Candidatus Thermoplasmatota archaeon]
MCRMMATRPASGPDAREILAGFRQQARFGQTGTPVVQKHPDGWGVVAGLDGQVDRWARSVNDA